MGRLYYSISEVSDMIGVKPHVLRYWETQFKMLRPKKGRGGARMYRKRDVEILFEVKQLLYDHRFTIAGARRKLLDERGSKEQMELGFVRTDREEMLPAPWTRISRGSGRIPEAPALRRAPARPTGHSRDRCAIFSRPSPEAADAAC